MENSEILLRLYKEFTGKNLNTNKQDDKVIMQKIVFLLNELRVTVGDYRFSWDKFGPFSQSLHNDIALIKKDDVPYDGEFSESAKKSILFLKEILNERINTSYSLRYWAEAVSSFLFLKRYVYPFHDWNDIKEKIISLKPYLNNEDGNDKAIKCCEQVLNFEW